MSSLIACPKCGEFEYYKSHTRNIFERLRKTIFHQRPYRCHSCNYRAWHFVKVISPGDIRDKRSTALYVAILAVSIVIGLIMASIIN